jgi:hypothetical protein
MVDAISARICNNVCDQIVQLDYTGREEEFEGLVTIRKQVAVRGST